MTTAHIDAKSNDTWVPFVRRLVHETAEHFGSGMINECGTYIGHGEVYDSKRGELKGVYNRGQFAADFMISERDEGQKIADWLWDNRVRLGIRYVIFWDRIISVTRNGKWNEYVNPVPSRRKTASGRHHNHVHVSCFSNGKYVGPVSGPAKPLTVTMYAKVNTIGYKIVNGVGKINKRVKPGYKIVGKIKSRSDGKYLVTRFGNWYPMDDLATTNKIK